MSDSSASASHARILYGLVLGAVVGSLVNAFTIGETGTPAVWVGWLVRNITQPIGDVFLRMLFMTVVPLVFASLAVGVAQLGDLSQLGRMGAKTFAYFILTMACAVVIGLVLVNVVEPGKGLPAETVAGLRAQFETPATANKAKPAEFGIQTFVDIIPKNPLEAATTNPPNMLGIIFFALLIGIGVTRLSGQMHMVALSGLAALGELMVFIIGLAMKLAPIGVFCLIFNTTSQFGFGLLVTLGQYVAVVLVGLALQMFVVLPILVRFLGGMNPWQFFSKTRAVMATAFGTSSSNATLPTSIRTAEQELGVPAPIAGFVLPLGATMNMNGTALFEGVTAVFLAQVMGVDLTLGQQFIVVVLCVLTAVGAAGVPGGSIPLLAMVLASVGVAPESIFIILGVDRILDMCRTTLNVMGDLTAAVYITRTERMPEEPDHPLSEPGEPTEA
ncbi:MAG: dicarboxylate/amino acid:cation symporter [Bacteroidales bacterium]|nr:dicarboxylate/amino acid:cation symporter [Bacteroidales bacterium]